jgi:hypothetical protein
MTNTLLWFIPWMALVCYGIYSERKRTKLAEKYYNDYLDVLDKAVKELLLKKQNIDHANISSI